MIGINEKLGAVIRARRVQLGMSQGAVGERMGITFQQVQKYEKGSNSLSVERLFEIAEALEWSAEGLLLASIEGQTSRRGISDRQEIEVVKRLNTLKPHEFKAVTAFLNMLCRERAA